MKTTDDVSQMLKDLFSETIQEMMEAELDTTLGFEKNGTSPQGRSNRRNGHTKKTIISEYGDAEISVPRDREGEHEPIIVKKHQKNLTGFSEAISACFPETEIQKCVGHQIRNSIR